MIRYILILLLLFVWGVDPAQAQMQQGTTPDGYTRYINHSEVRLLSSNTVLSQTQETLIGLHIRLDPKWHTYWRNPGDSGAAPTLEASFSGADVEVGPIQWPLPERIPTPPLMTFGYENEVLIYLPVRLKNPPPVDLKTVTLTLAAEWLVCNIECIPAFDTFTQDFAVNTPAEASSEQTLFASWQQQLPPVAEQASVYQVEDGALLLRVAGLPAQARITDFLPFDSPFLSNEALSEAVDKTPVSQRISLSLVQPIPEPAPEIQGLVLYEIDGLPGSLSIQAHSSPAGLVPGTDADKTSLWQWMLMAFAGGLILNIMPCVFPILAIKLMGILKQAQDQPLQVRLSSLVYIAGVLVTFEAFALLLVLLRASGQALGWGFQLQSPVFLTGLILLFFLLSLNFLGLYEFRLPLVQTGPQKQGYVGHFATGALSVLVASPCTAPFMGAAMGFALSQSVAVILLVFLALGLGFALPYLLLLISPKTVQWLPKPGHWMILFKEFMFFPMLLTALWLLWILGRIAGLEAAVAVLLGLTLLTIPFWLKQRLPVRNRLLLGTWMLCVPLGLGASFWPLLQPASETPAVFNKASLWQPFSPASLTEARATGAVFVNFTAAWCITCQVNEQVTFRNAEIQQLIQQQGIQMLKADWTRRDPQITDILSQYGRVSVPFYLFYPFGETTPKVLPEVLTPAIFKEYMVSTSAKEIL